MSARLPRHQRAHCCNRSSADAYHESSSAAAERTPHGMEGENLLWWAAAIDRDRGVVGSGIAESWVQGSRSRGFRRGSSCERCDIHVVPPPHRDSSRYTRMRRVRAAHSAVTEQWTRRGALARCVRGGHAAATTPERERVATGLWSVSAASSRNYAGAHKPGEPSDKARWRAHALSRAGKV